jgi:hypothetical protein
VALSLSFFPPSYVVWDASCLSLSLTHHQEVTSLHAESLWIHTLLLVGGAGWSPGTMSSQLCDIALHVPSWQAKLFSFCKCSYDVHVTHPACWPASQKLFWHALFFLYPHKPWLCTTLRKLPLNQKGSEPRSPAYYLCACMLFTMYVQYLLKQRHMGFMPVTSLTTYTCGFSLWYSALHHTLCHAFRMSLFRFPRNSSWIDLYLQRAIWKKTEGGAPLHPLSGKVVLTGTL